MQLTLGLLALLAGAAAAAADFENTAIVRSVELGGALVKSTTTFAVRALRDGAGTYTLALPPREAARTRWMEAGLKGAKTKLPLQAALGVRDGEPWTYELTLPTPLAENGTANIVLETVQTDATYPWPREAAQGDPQVLKFDTDLFVVSPYETVVQRTKIRAPVPKIQTYTTPAGVDAFVKDAAVTKAGTTLTYGPFSGVPASASGAFAITHQRAIAVQYGYDSPVLEVRTLRRWAEVSHWGANLNVQDELALHNAGPTLKGHFSRLEHQSQKFYGKLAPHVVPQLTLHLPAGLRDAYYYDIIGNVSTSNLRAAPRGSAAPSVLELRPRYPLLGGWNYSFTLGWDADLGDAARYDAASGRYVLAVPIMAPLPGAAVQRAELTIVLPEGAADVRLATPFPPVAMTRETHSTYLDSAGRPALTLEYAHLTDKHAGVVYVSYGVSAPAHVRKVGTVAVALFSIFVLAMGARRVDLSLARKK